MKTMIKACIHRFDKIDVNGDHLLSREEIEKYCEQYPDDNFVKDPQRFFE